MSSWHFDATNAADLEKKLSDFEGKLLSYEKVFSTRDPRREKAQGLRGRVQAWRKDFDYLYVIWDRWNRNCDSTRDHKDTNSASVSPEAVELRQRSVQLDVDVPSFYYFAGMFLDHAAECVGFLLGSEVLGTHEALCRREVLPAPLQEIGLALQEEMLWYQRKQAEDSGSARSGVSADSRTAHDIPDLTDLLKKLQTYAFGLAEFLDKAIQHPALKSKHLGTFEPAPKRVPLLWVGGIVLALVAGLLVVPSWTCVQSSVEDVWDSSEMEPPLPANCQLTTDQPSEATLSLMESRRKERGLEFERVVTCKMSGPTADPRWLEGFYIEKTMQHRRHVFIAEMQKVPGGGVLFAVECCLMPRWRYLKRMGGRCDAQI
jgi:hypothetical protein